MGYAKEVKEIKNMLQSLNKALNTRLNDIQAGIANIQASLSGLAKDKEERSDVDDALKKHFERAVTHFAGKEVIGITLIADYTAAEARMDAQDYNEGVRARLEKDMKSQYKKVIDNIKNAAKMGKREMKFECSDFFKEDEERTQTISRWLRLAGFSVALSKYLPHTEDLKTVGNKVYMTVSW